MAQQMMKEERSLGDLFSELASETSALVRQEVALAQVELTQKATKIGKNVGFLVVGGSIAFAALQAFLAAVIIGLSYFIPAWAAALLVGVVVAIVAYLLVTMAISNLKNMSLAPQQTVESLKEDAEWLKNEVT